MIKTKNKADLEFLLKKAGSASATNDVDNFVVPCDGVISAVYAAYGVMGTDGTGGSQDVRVDIKKNGTSIFTGATTVIAFAHAAQVGTANTGIAASSYGTLTTNPTKVTKGDKLQLDVTQILNGAGPTQPTDLSVVIVIRRKYQSSSPMLGGQIDSLD